ncbi:hypothetical protein P8C59_000573 [Phyllachora maydis]|uniref:Uncharacterized protein n=1 Tax=Phyllachora maydis TaxID=1825666 RepID=A0AAD9HXN3_9PEZI|nr:hypothetical protein P8C59_000573 [Phyllachora maydis]
MSTKPTAIVVASAPTSPAQAFSNSTSPTTPVTPLSGRRASAEWDAAQTPPSRFQKRKGSIYAVPHSRDGHIDSNYPQKFHELYAEKGYNKIK